MEKICKRLDEARVDIAADAFQAEVLFKTIMSYEMSNEITALSELGENVCRKIREHTEEIEFTLDEIKKRKLQ